MVEIRLNDLTRRFVGYHQLPELPRLGDGIFLTQGDQFSDRLHVVDVTFRQPAANSPFDIEVFESNGPKLRDERNRA